MTKVAGRIQRVKNFAALTLPMLLAVAVEGEDWTQFRGPNRVGVRHS